MISSASGIVVHDFSGWCCTWFVIEFIDLELRFPFTLFTGINKVLVNIDIRASQILDFSQQTHANFDCYNME